jgi:hypothetical protein
MRSAVFVALFMLVVGAGCATSRALTTQDAVAYGSSTDPAIAADTPVAHAPIAAPRYRTYAATQVPPPPPPPRWEPARRPAPVSTRARIAVPPAPAIPVARSNTAAPRPARRPVADPFGGYAPARPASRCKT